MDTRQRVIQRFKQRFGKPPEALAFAPGRVNLLGEHVDYNDGIVLPAAIDRLTTIAFSAAPDADSCLVALDFSEETSFSRLSRQEKCTTTGTPLPIWAHYPAGVAWAIDSAGLTAPALNAVFASDVPIAAGLSSSASVEMAFAKAWSYLGKWSLSSIEFAKLGQKAENDYVGIHSGIMDQFASACGIVNKLLLLDCRTLDWRSLLMPEGVDIIVADSTIRRQLTDSAYNDRRRSCEAALAELRQVIPGIRSLRDVSLEQFNQHCHRLSPTDEKRARHVVEEINRTQQAVILLENGCIREFGQMMNACHASLRDLYQVSTPELDFLAETAQNLPGCIGSRLTGAGFGGCTVNLVEKSSTTDFTTALDEAYRRNRGLNLKAYICKPSAGHRVLSLHKNRASLA